MDDNKGLILGAVIAVLALGVGGFLLFSNDDDATDDSSATESSQMSDQDATSSTEAAEETQTIVALAQATPSLSTLVSAVVEAQLVDTLNGEGPFTVFAPTDDAFAAALEELDITAQELLAREDLAAILTYHVVAGDVRAADLSDGQIVETVQGETLTVSIGNAVTLTDANGRVSTVTATDIAASNGVVHLIDTVVLPQL